MAQSRRIVIIGGGVVGLACAERFASGGHDVVLVERQDQLGQGTSSRNSEVIHAGIYYPDGSLKAALCVEGRERLLAFCAADDVDHLLVGKLVVATTEAEIKGLDCIEACAIAAASDPPLQRWTPDRIQDRAPAVRAVAALWSAGTGIVDTHGLMARLASRARASGALLLTRQAVVAAEPRRSRHRIALAGPDGRRDWHEFEVVINAAGHGAVPICRLAGLSAPEIVPIKGSYFSIVGTPPADCLVYPVPSRPLVSLGVHLTVDLAGQARLGPDKSAASSASDLHVDPARAVDFHAAATRYLPGLRLADLRPAYAGVRPKLAGDDFADFWIRAREKEGLPDWIDLLGIDSPGLTASMAIARAVGVLIAAE